MLHAVVVYIVIAFLCHFKTGIHYMSPKWSMYCTGTGNLTLLAISCKMRSVIVYACMLYFTFLEVKPRLLSCKRNLLCVQQSEAQYGYPLQLWHQINSLEKHTCVCIHTYKIARCVKFPVHSYMVLSKCYIAM